MGRDIGPVEKLSRREGVELELKGLRLLEGKSAMERRPYPPGQHGRGRRRASEYATRLREKQRTKRFYGLREKQFRNLYARAGGGTRLLRLLELRLDNVVYRLGFATTRAQARQFVVHGHVRVNGRRVDLPSARLRPDDLVSLRPGSRVEPLVREATGLVGRVPTWLLADHDELWGRVERVPERDEIAVPADEKLIVEFYAK
ncbi:MAG TPA: 30S ribosomal protein S4 [Thermoleophilia bacterium]|nr:30S ribosomal protein S4 [Thermoleophilia bacterium]